MSDKILSVDGAGETIKPSSVAADFPKLSQRERDILHLVAMGYTARKIGEFLGISPRTADKHIQNLGKKLGSRNKAHMVGLASAMKLIDSSLILPAPPDP